jgi:anti-anti-sigma factor
MENMICNTNEGMTVTYSQLSELVRGEDRSLLDRIGPMVAQQNIALDLSGVERIDAAGISALIRLYGYARDAGHRFTLSNVSPRVEQILKLVGLDRILLSHNVVCLSHSATQFDRPAA